jgi:hypothetical protein
MSLDPERLGARRGDRAGEAAFYSTARLPAMAGLGG